MEVDGKPDGALKIDKLSCGHTKIDGMSLRHRKS